MKAVKLFPADIYNQKTIQQGHPPDWTNRQGGEYERKGSANDRMPAPARCISRAIIKRSVVSRERRSTAGVTTTSPAARRFISFLSCGRQIAAPA